MDDVEKNRSEYVQRLETQVKHLQRQLSEIQSMAQWIPAVNMEMDMKQGFTRFIIAFNGKRVSAEVSNQSFSQSEPGDIVTAVVDSFSENLLKDQFKPLILPEVLKAKQATSSIKDAGKW